MRQGLINHSLTLLEALRGAGAKPLPVPIQKSYAFPMTNQHSSAISRSLFILSILYGGLVCIAGVLGNKLVTLGPVGDFFGNLVGLGPLAVEAGIFAFIFLVILSSAVAEVHGREIANKLVLYGFIPLIASMLLIRFVIALPPAPFWEEDRRIAFDLVVNQSARMMLAGMISYGTSQLLNVFIFTRMRQGGGRLLWLRAMIAGVLSQALDTLLFISISFWGVAPIAQIMPGQMAAKILLSALVMPALIYLFVGLARRLDR